MCAHTQIHPQIHLKSLGTHPLPLQQLFFTTEGQTNPFTQCFQAELHVMGPMGSGVSTPGL